MAAKVGVAYIDVKPNFDGFERAVRQQSDGITSRVGGAFAGAGKMAVKAFAGVGAVAAVAGGAGLKIASNMEQAQVAFTTMLGSADKAKAHLADLSQFAAKTPFELPGLINMSRQLQAMGFQAEQVKPMMTAVGDTVSAMGGGQAELDRVTTALGQMNAKTKVSAEEMMQLSELGIPAWELLAQATGKTVPEVQKLASEGKITSDVFINAFTNMQGPLEKFRGSMEAQSQTLQGMWSTLKDTVSQGLGNMAQPLVDSLKSSFPAINQAIGDLFTQVGPPLAALVGQIGQTLGAILPVVAPILSGLAQLLTTILAPIIPVIGEIATALGAAFQAIMPALMPLAQVIGDIFAQIGGAIAEMLPDLVPIITSLAELLTGLFRAAQPILDVFIAQISAALKMLTPIIEVVADVFGAMFERMRPMIEQLVPLWVQIGEKLGAVFSQIAETVGPVLMDVMSQIFDAIAPVLPLVADAVMQLVEAFAPLLPQIAELATAFLPLLPPVLKLVVSLLELFMPVLTTVADLLAGALGAALTVVTPLIQGVVTVLGWLVDGLRWVVDGIGWLIGAIGPAFNGIWQGIQTAWDLILPVFQAIWDFITITLAPVWDFLGGVVQGVWQGIQSVIGVVWSVLQPIFEAIWNIISGVVIPIVQNLWNIVSAVFQGIATVAQWVWDSVLYPVFSTIASIISTVLTPVFQTIGAVVSAVWNGIGSAISWVWNSVIKPIWDGIGAAIDWLVGVFHKISDAWSSVWNGLGDIVSSVWNSIISGIETAINWVIGLINGLLDGINSAMEYLPGEWTPLHIDEVHLTGRAKGGPVTAGTPYLVGERGPEVFTPSTSGTIIPNGVGGTGTPVGGDSPDLVAVLGALVDVLATVAAALATPTAGTPLPTGPVPMSTGPVPVSPVAGGDGAAMPGPADPATLAASAGATDLTTVAVTSLGATNMSTAMAAAGLDAQLTYSTTTTLPLATLAVQTQDLTTQALTATQLANIPVQVFWQQTLAVTQAWFDAVTAAVGRLIQQLLVLNATRITISVDRSQVDAAASSISNLAATIASSLQKLGLDSNVLAQWLGVVLALPANVLAGAVKAETGGVVGRDTVGAGFATSTPTLVGEGSTHHREWVIPTDPRHRSNAWALTAGLLSDLGVPAMASGGILGQTPFSGTAANVPGLLLKVLAGSLMSAAAIGASTTTGGAISGDDYHAIENYLTQAGMPFTEISTVRPGARTHATGALSYHATGDAVDLGGDLYRIWETLDKLGGAAEGGVLQELIYAGAPTYIGGGTRKPIDQLNRITYNDHHDHVHAAIPRDTTVSGGAAGGPIDVPDGWKPVGQYIVDHFRQAGVGGPPVVATGVPPEAAVPTGEVLSGRVSEFGGPNDHMAGGGFAYTGEPVMSAYNRGYPYAAMYDRKYALHWLDVEHNGAHIAAHVVDKGPAPWTGRILDLAPYLLSGLGAVTDDIVNISVLGTTPGLAEGGLTVSAGQAYVHDNEVHLPLGDSRTVDALAEALEQAGGSTGMDQRQYHFHEVMPTAQDIADELYWRDFVGSGR